MDLGVAVALAGGARDGVVSWSELRSAGLSSAALSRALAAGELVRLHRGVYAHAPAVGLAAVAAAVLSLAATASHDSAAQLWDLPLAHAPEIHVTVDRDRSRARAAGVRVHRLGLASTDVEERFGVRVTTVQRTVLDCARSLPLRHGVVVADAAIRAGHLSAAELVSAAAAARGPGASRVRRVAALADGSAESPLESLLRVLLVTAGLSPSHTQFQVRDGVGRLVAVADFCYLDRRLLVEADGFEFHRQRRDYRADRRKANACTGLGWRLLRFSWEDVLFDEAYVIATVGAELRKPLPVAG